METITWRSGKQLVYNDRSTYVQNDKRPNSLDMEHRMEGTT